MITFLEYHLKRQIREILSESEWTTGQPWYSSNPERPKRYQLPIHSEDPSIDENDLYRRGVLEGDHEAMRELDAYWRPLFVGRFYRKFRDLPLEDVEDAYQRSFSSLISGRTRPRENESIVKLFQTYMQREMIQIWRRKKTRERAASGLADYARERQRASSDKDIFDDEENLESAIARTPDLTPREIQALRLAASGVSSRSLGLQLDPPVPSAATSWRIYDSAVSKIRLAHGLSSTRQERDKKKIDRLSDES